MTEELEQGVSKEIMKGSGEKKIFEFFDKFNGLGEITDFNSEKFMRNWAARAEDLGLSYFEEPENENLLGAKTGSFGGGQQERKRDQDANSEEMTLLEDNLRALMIQKYLSTDIRSKFMVNLKIRKLKNGLKKLGIFKPDLIKKIEEEGRGVAKFKFLEMLREAFAERATLVSFQTPGYKLVKNKIKTVLKAFKALGEPLAKFEIKALRDSVNKEIFDIVREEYLKIEMQSELQPNRIDVIQRKKDLLGILERLKEESNILMDIKPEMFKKKAQAANRNIEEAV
jgi:hypothetical protein